MIKTLFIVSVLLAIVDVMKEDFEPDQSAFVDTRGQSISKEVFPSLISQPWDAGLTATQCIVMGFVQLVFSLSLKHVF